MSDDVSLYAPATLRRLVEIHGGAVDERAPLDHPIVRIGASDREGSVDLAPVLTPRGARNIVTGAAILLVATSVSEEVPTGRRWVHPRADHVLAALLDAPRGPPFAPCGVASSAPSDDERLEQGAIVGVGVVVTNGARVCAGAVVYPGVRIGARVIIGAGSVVGAPGFGFVDTLDGDRAALRYPHRAGVVLGDDVEIGALCTVDAGIVGPTTIGAGTKLDAQVHVGHGVRVGARCRIAAQVGLAGSVVVEDDVHIGGQAGVADHVRIGRGARIAAKSGVIGDVPEGAVFAGYPAVARARWLRGQARLYRGR